MANGFELMLADQLAGVPPDEIARRLAAGLYPGLGPPGSGGLESGFTRAATSPEVQGAVDSVARAMPVFGQVYGGYEDYGNKLNEPTQGAPRPTKPKAKGGGLVVIGLGLALGLGLAFAWSKA